MDVYVLSRLWNDGAGIVLGAGASLDDAKEIAKRWETGPFEWDEWVDDPGPGLRAQRWTRTARIGARQMTSLMQEIVCVPLAGSVFPETIDPLAGLKRIVPIDDRWGGAGAGEIYQTRERTAAIHEAISRHLLAGYRIGKCYETGPFERGEWVDEAGRTIAVTTPPG